MIFDNLAFHNVKEVTTVAGRPRILCRVSQELNEYLEPDTVARYQNPANSEIRFKTTKLPVEIYVTIYDHPVDVAIYFGDYQFSESVLPIGDNKIVIDDEPYLEPFFKAAPKGKFSTHVIRVIFSSTSAEIGYRSLSTEGIISPPSSGEIPKLKYLAYGTSITHGYHATTPVLPYCYQTAHRMQADLYNMGVGGAAFMEEKLGEYIANEFDFDVFTAEISVNMLNQGYTEAEYYHRAKEFLSIIDRKHPDKIKAVISILGCFWDVGIARPAAKSTVARYRQITEELCAEFQGRYLFLDGTQLIHMNNLSCDLIHPGNLGMIELGENIAKKIMDYFPSFFDKQEV